MPDLPTTKIKQSIDALKGANKHLSEVFDHQTEMENAMSSVADDLKRLMSEVGNIHTQQYYDGKFQQRPLRATLASLADKLEKARS